MTRPLSCRRVRRLLPLFVGRDLDEGDFYVGIGAAGGAPEPCLLQHLFGYQARYSHTGFRTTRGYQERPA